MMGKPGEMSVSEVVGEMLMIGLAILLISVFASLLGNFAPAAHDPSVTVLMTNDPEGNVTLWHKGGDWVKDEELTIIIGNDTHRKSYPHSDARFILVPKKTAFDLGSNITVITGVPFASDETVSLVTSRAKIFSGAVKR